jgi:hypothetical protein
LEERKILCLQETD